MSGYPSYVIRCDGEDCAERFTVDIGERTTQTDVRQEARTRGWRFVSTGRGQDYCPKCALAHSMAWGR